MDLVFPLLEMAPIGFLIIAALTRREPDVEKQWLVRILTIAYIFRLACATAFAAVPDTRIFHDDAEGYEGIGMAMANYWHGAGPYAAPLEEFGNYGYFYVCAGVYYLFGPFRAAASYFNCIIGTGTIFLVYRLSRRFFHIVVARRAALLVAFVPSMILWSAMTLKDTVTTFLIILTLLSCVRMKEQLTPRNMFLTLLPIIAIQPIRFYMLYFLGMAVVVSLFFERGQKLITGVPKSLLIGGLVAMMLVLVGLSGSAESSAGLLNFEKLNSFRHGMAETANTGFAADVDISSPGRALAFLPIGLAYLLLAPFPWQFGSLRSLFAAPETILWWFMFPSMISGFRFAIQKRFAALSPVIFFTMALTPAYALMHGNVGSAFRQRSQIFVFLFIFTAAGHYVRRLRRNNQPTDVVLSGSK